MGSSVKGIESIVSADMTTTMEVTSSNIADIRGYVSIAALVGEFGLTLPSFACSS